MIKHQIAGQELPFLKRLLWNSNPLLTHPVSKAIFTQTATLLSFKIFYCNQRLLIAKPLWEILISLSRVLFLRTAIPMFCWCNLLVLKNIKTRRIGGLRYYARTHTYFGSKAHLFKMLSNDAPRLLITLPIHCIVVKLVKQEHGFWVQTKASPTLNLAKVFNFFVP